MPKRIKTTSIIATFITNYYNRVRVWPKGNFSFYISDRKSCKTPF